MSGRHHRTWLLVAITGIALALAGCGNDDTDALPTLGASASSTATLDPMAGAPSEGSCFRLSASDLDRRTSTKRAVNCYSRHTSITYHVGLFPPGTVESDHARVERVCTNRLPKGSGLTSMQLNSTIIGWAWFEPTTAQWSAGARWFRCDLVARAGDTVKRLPSTTGAPFSNGIPDRFVKCMRDVNDQGTIVTCDERHDFRWAGSFELPQGRDFPSDKEVADIVGERCKQFLDVTQRYYYEWPKEDDWLAGDRLFSCYEQNTS